jgi:hypothetical protein
MDPSLDLNHDHHKKPERTYSDSGMAGSPLAPQEILAKQTSSLPNFPYNELLQVQEPFLETQNAGFSLAITCPFLFVGCKFVAFGCAEWSAHLRQHRCA